MLDDLNFYIIWICLALVAFLLATIVAFIFRKFKEKIVAKIRGILDKLIFNGIIRSATIAYIQTCMTSGEQIKLWLKGSEYSKGQERAVASIMMFLMFMIPILSFATVEHFRPKLDEE